MSFLGLFYCCNFKYFQSSSLSTAGNTTEVKMSKRFCDPKKDIDEEEEEREEEEEEMRGSQCIL